MFSNLFTLICIENIKLIFDESTYVNFQKYNKNYDSLKVMTE